MRALAGAELGAKLVLAGAELGAKLVLAGAELIDCETKLSNQRTQVAISRQALRGRRGRLPEFPQQHHKGDARPREHSLRRGDRKAQPRRRGYLHVAGAWSGLLSLSGAQMVADGYSEA